MGEVMTLLRSLSNWLCKASSVGYAFINVLVEQHIWYYMSWYKYCCSNLSPHNIYWRTVDAKEIMCETTNVNSLWIYLHVDLCVLKVVTTWYGWSHLCILGCHPSSQPQPMMVLLGISTWRGVLLGWKALKWHRGQLLHKIENAQSVH